MMITSTTECIDLFMILLTAEMLNFVCKFKIKLLVIDILIKLQKEIKLKSIDQKVGMFFIKSFNISYEYATFAG